LKIKEKFKMFHVKHFGLMKKASGKSLKNQEKMKKF